MVAEVWAVEKTKHERLAYLLRLWPSESGERCTWRATLQNPYSAEQHAFASLQALFAFLRSQTEGPTDAPGAGEGGKVEESDGVDGTS